MSDVVVSAHTKSISAKRPTRLWAHSKIKILLESLSINADFADKLIHNRKYQERQLEVAALSLYRSNLRGHYEYIFTKIPVINVKEWREAVREVKGLSYGAAYIALVEAAAYNRDYGSIYEWFKMVQIFFPLKVEYIFNTPPTSQVFPGEEMAKRTLKKWKKNAKVRLFKFYQTFVHPVDALLQNMGVVQSVVHRLHSDQTMHTELLKKSLAVSHEGWQCSNEYFRETPKLDGDLERYYKLAQSDNLYGSVAGNLLFLHTIAEALYKCSVSQLFEELRDSLGAAMLRPVEADYYRQIAAKSLDGPLEDEDYNSVFLVKRSISAIGHDSAAFLGYINGLEGKERVLGASLVVLLCVRELDQHTAGGTRTILVSARTILLNILEELDPVTSKGLGSQRQKRLKSRFPIV